MPVRTLLIMAGGTGGHIFPGLAIAEEMRTRGWNVEWLGTKNSMESQIVPKSLIPFHALKFEGVVGRGMFAKIKLPVTLFGALLAARRILRCTRPTLVLGMGGYPALPGGLMARWLRLVLVVHEQNAVAGKTNQLLARFATKVLAAFPGAFDSTKVSAQVVGNPVRRDVEAIVSSEWDGTRPLRIAVVGGSRGAKALNEIVPAALSKLSDTQRPQVTHQCGKGNVEPVRDAYQSYGVAVQLHEFIDDMPTLYQETDLMICRSGASTVSELSCARMPSILVPYPYHADQQQLHNAKFLTDSGGALLMEQKSLTAEALAQAIARVTPTHLHEMKNKLDSHALRGATANIANVLESLGGRS